MRPSSLWLRGTLCVLSLAVLSSPAVAGPKKGGKKASKVSVASCTTFDQIDHEDAGLDLVVANRCEIKLACSVSWTLTCQPAAGRSRKSQHGQAFSLATDTSETTSVSAETCGNDGWAIDDVSWSCQPEKGASVASR
jgi:hypothetical protein